MRGDEQTKASKMPQDELSMYPELEKAQAKVKWFETYKRSQLDDRIKKIRDNRQKSSILVPSKFQAINNEEDMRKSTMKEQGKLTKYLMRMA